MDKQTVEAVKLLGLYTAGRFDVWMLAGNASAARRQHVMSTLAGHKVPRAKSGVTALRSLFYERMGIVGDCLAEREHHFITACKAVAA